MIMTTNSFLVIPRPTSHRMRERYRENASQPLHASHHALLVIIILPLNPYTVVTDPDLILNFPVSILRFKVHCSSADGAPNNTAVQAMGFSAPRILSAGLSSRTKLVCGAYLLPEHVFDRLQISKTRVTPTISPSKLIPGTDRKSTRLNSSHDRVSRMPSSA